MNKIWVVGLALCFACGDDDGGGGGSGVAGTKKVSDLTDKEYAALCKSVVGSQYSGITERQWCTLGAALLSRDEAMCIEVRDACEDADALSDDKEDSLASCDEETVPDDCDVTVAKMEKCAEDLTAVFTSFVKSTSCDDAGSIDEPDDPASCDEIPDGCFPEDDEESTLPSIRGSHLKARLAKLRAAH